MQSKVHFFVAQLPQLLPSDWSTVNEPTLAVVIDTLRFTSTACVALEAGAASVCVAAEVESARQLGKQLGSGTLLCGERHCHRIEGFQLGNSPFEYTPEVVASHDLVFSTTNGTRAVAAAEEAKQILLASLLNRAAIVDWIFRSSYKRVWILCAGTDGQIAAEDVLTAGAILSGCQMHDVPCKIANDSAAIALQLFESLRHQAGSVSEVAIDGTAMALLTQAAGGQNLIQSGYAPDIAAVSRLDSINIVPGNSPAQPTRFGIV
jgi:2-phosphosulfolactate phosphatase